MNKNFLTFISKIKMKHECKKRNKNLSFDKSKRKNLI